MTFDFHFLLKNNQISRISVCKFFSERKAWECFQDKCCKKPMNARQKLINQSCVRFLDSLEIVVLDKLIYIHPLNCFSRKRGVITFANA